MKASLALPPPASSAVRPASVGREWSLGFRLPVVPAAYRAPAPAPASASVAVCVATANAAPAPAMPNGWHTEDRVDGLHLIREADAQDMGIMASPAFAARFAGCLSRFPSA